MSGIVQIMLAQSANEGFDYSYDAGNLVSFPEDIKNGWWTKGYLDIDTDNTLSPSGSATSVLYEGWSATNTRIKTTLLTITPNIDYTVKFWVKRGTVTDMRWGIQNTVDEDVVPPTSYLAQTTAGVWSLVTLTFNVPNTFIYVYPAYEFGSTGTFEIWGVQVYPTP